MILVGVVRKVFEFEEVFEGMVSVFLGNNDGGTSMVDDKAGRGGGFPGRFSRGFGPY